MATKEVTDPAEVSTKPGKKKILLIAGPLVVVLAAGWFFVGPGKGKGAAEKLAPIPGAVVALEPLTLNLADGRLLRLGLALQMEKTSEKDKDFSGAMALDEAITLLGARTFAQLSAPGGREKAKAELSTRVVERYKHGVLGVLFTEFLMQ